MPEKSAALRTRLTARIAAILLEDGVAVLPLRELAARLKTSDRMLLYYFISQSDLVRAALGQISAMLALRLEQALPPARLPADRLLKKLLDAMAQPDIAPILKVWADVAARGARGEQPFADFAGGAVTAWLPWIAARLDMKAGPQRQKMAAAILVVIEGQRLVEVSAPGITSGAVSILIRGLEPR